MSESHALNQTETSPQPIFLKDYQVPNYLIDEIDLYFDLYEDHVLVKSHMRIRHNRLSQNTSRDLRLNGEELELIAVTLNGKVLTKSEYEKDDQFLTIYQVGDKAELEIVNKIYPQKNKALSGLYRSGKTFCTQCEAEGFRRITYFLDEPDVLSRFTTTITADKVSYPYLLSNGNLITTQTIEEGRYLVKWEDPFKKPCYLFALVAGDFDILEDKFITISNREIILKIYVEKGYGDQAYHAMTALKEAMAWDEKNYGREYDLDVYMIVAIGDFNSGAMENKGLNIFNTKYILAKPEVATDTDYIHILSVVGHEYFHNWSGNRVTCRDWFQLSLKEGLTIFRDQSFTEDTLSPAVMRIHDVKTLREIQFPEDAGPLAHPVRPDSYIEIRNFYTPTVYNKGAEVLRMLQTILGKSLFRKGMDLYFARHDGQAVTIEDYIKAMEDVSGIDLKQFRLWYSQAGTPVVSVTEDYNPQQKIYSLTFSQSCPKTPGGPDKLPMYVPIKMGLLDKSGHDISLYINDEKETKEKVLHLTKASETFQFKEVNEHPVPSLLRNFSAPVKLNYPYTESDLQFLFEHDPDPFNRYEAGQRYIMQILLSLINDYQHNKPLNLPSGLPKTFEHILHGEHQDKFLLAEMLLLPSERYIGEQMNIIDVDAIFEVREFVRKSLALHLAHIFFEIYQANHDPSAPYEFNMEAVGKRQLKNRCLSYLMCLPQYIDLGIQQFESSLTSNMSDTEPALSALSNIDSPIRIKALDQFYAAWKHDALVVDKWLAIQATTKLPIALSAVQKLSQHEAFDIKNPNKVYALIGSFSQRNPVNFHRENGEGYAFLREIVRQLDEFNSEIAARMVKPLTNFKRYDKERQMLMLKQLELLAQDKKISKDLYEVVTKSLQK